jgi:hypothetical protein
VDHGIAKIQRAFRAIDRLTRVRSRRGRRYPKRGRPVGPKLVVGRGLSRRRTDMSSILTTVFALALAAAIVLAVARFWLTPILTGG